MVGQGVLLEIRNPDGVWPRTAVTRDPNSFDPYISQSLSKSLVVLSNFSNFLDIYIECALTERLQW